MIRIVNFLARLFQVYIGLVAVTTYAQEIPPIRNFTPSDYNSESQNWSISQSTNKLIYIANNRGLLVYNGENWDLYPSPNETIMRSVKVIGDRIYTGCYMEFGYWSANDLGTLDYTSISQQSELELSEDEEFWNIESIDDWIVFQSLERIYVYNLKDESLYFIESDDEITSIFKVEDDIYFYKLGAGIFKIENGREQLFISDEATGSDEVVGVFAQDYDLLVLTKTKGFFRIDRNQQVVDQILNENLKGLSVYDALQLNDGGFAIGTISKGLLHLAQDFNTIDQINKSNGLANNTVLSVFEDVDGNIWTGLDNGISFINKHAPIQFFRDENGTMGSIYASAIFEGHIYFGTNQGLFRKRIDDGSSIEFIKNTEGQVWSLDIIDNTLFCAHHIGSFIVEGNRVKKIEGTQGTWGMKLLSDGLILEGRYDGLYVLEKSNGSWKVRNKIQGFNNSSRYFEVLDNQIFVNHEYKGIFNITVDDAFQEVQEVKEDTIHKGANSGIAKYNDAILYIYDQGIFRYDQQTRDFVKDSLLSESYNEAEYISGRVVVENGNFWMFTKSSLVNVSSNNLTKVPRIKYYPITQEVRQNVVEFENIISLDGLSKFLIGSSTGYLVVDVSDLHVDDFEVQIAAISKGIKPNHKEGEVFVSKEEPGEYPRDENNIRIEFYTPEYYRYFQTNYQYRLIGLYDDWSQWSTETTVFFENLPSGTYTFDVRSKIGDKLSSSTASYTFRIKSAWYASNTMIMIYIILFILLVILVHSLYRSYYKNKHNKLIEQNRKELELTKLQNEKEIIKLKNEQLEEEYKSKSKELAASTMSIIKQNELLTQIKDQLTEVTDKKSISPVIKIINKHLSGNESWELFKEAFNNADSEFFKKLKSKHPDLSPNDLKLCAYLRLNLSSKEIAPLFNISPRSVEIKRYRLRKKLDLETNENLTSYILSL